MEKERAGLPKPEVHFTTGAKFVVSPTGTVHTAAPAWGTSNVKIGPRRPWPVPLRKPAAAKQPQPPPKKSMPQPQPGVQPQPQLKKQHKNDTGIPTQPGRRETVPDSELMQRIQEAAPRGILCPISHVLMRDPVVASDGFTYQRAALQAHVDKARREGKELCSPVTQKRMDAAFFPNTTFKTMVEEYVAAEREELLKEVNA